MMSIEFDENVNMGTMSSTHGKEKRKRRGTQGLDLGSLRKLPVGCEEPWGPIKSHGSWTTILQRLTLRNERSAVRVQVEGLDTRN